MTPTKGGRHCERCEKTIVDFSTKTDREIAHLYKQSEGKICGRFSKEQLRRDIVLHPKSLSNTKSKAAAALLAGMLSAGTAVAQGEIVVQRTEQKVSQEEKESQSPNSTKIITGHVYDEDGEPLPFANIYFKWACVGTTTDIDGYFSWKIPQDVEKIHVSYISYDEIEVELDSTTNDEMKIVMQSSESCLSVGIVIVRYPDSYFQDPPRGRTLPQLIKDWIYNIKEKRSNRKPKPQPENLPSPILIEAEIPEIRPPQIITKKLITKIFPNPFDNKIHLTLESDAVEILRVVIYDSMSREIHAEQINVLVGTNEMNINLREKQLTNGSYFLSIFRGNEIIQTEILTRIKK